MTENFDSYQLLGIPQNASIDEVRRAYEHRAQFIQYQVAQNPALVEHARQSMLDLDRAWYAVTNPVATPEHAGPLAPRKKRRVKLPNTDISNGLPNPTTGECQLCGSTPACHIHLMQVTGMILIMHRKTVKTEACRSCGLALFRRMMNRTLITGWFGLVAAVVNVYAIIRNVIARSNLGKLAKPSPTSNASPLDAPMNPGGSIFKRPGFYFGTFLVLWIAGGLLLA